MTPVRLEPAASRSRVKHSTTEPLRSRGQQIGYDIGYANIWLIVLQIEDEMGNKWGDGQAEMGLVGQQIGDEQTDMGIVGGQIGVGQTDMGLFGGQIGDGQADFGLV